MLSFPLLGDTNNSGFSMGAEERLILWEAQGKRKCDERVFGRREYQEIRLE